MSKKVKDEETRKKLHALIEKEQWDDLVALSKELWEKTDEKEKDKLKEVYDYYANNRKALDRYWNRLPKEILEKIPGGLVRGMGTMESTIHNTLGDRMKRVAWSIDGAEAVAKALCLKHSDRGDEAMGKIIYGRDLTLVEKNVLSKMMKQKMVDARKDVNNAVRDIIRETKEKRKVSCVSSHIAAFDGKITQLTYALKGMLSNPA